MNWCCIQFNSCQVQVESMMPFIYSFIYPIQVESYMYCDYTCVQYMCLSNMAIGKMNWWYLENAVVHFCGGIPYRALVTWPSQQSCISSRFNPDESRHVSEVIYDLSKCWSLGGELRSRKSQLFSRFCISPNMKLVQCVCMTNMK